MNRAMAEAGTMKRRPRAAVRQFELERRTEAERARPVALPLAAGSPGASIQSVRVEHAWLLLFGCLAASAGHGLFLLVAVTRNDLLPPLRDLGGMLLAPSVIWFAAAPLATLLALVLRPRIVRLSIGPARILATGAVLASLAAFATVLFKVAAA